MRRHGPFAFERSNAINAPVTKTCSLIRAFGVAFLVGSAAACGSLPTEGPITSEVMAKQSDGAAPYAVIDLSPEIADLLSVGGSDAFSETFGSQSVVPSLTIGVGDTVTITIFEAAAGGLFSGEPGSIGAANKNTTLPPQVVGQDGTITVPFAGRIRAAGRTPGQIQASVEAALQSKAIQPQVVVSVSDPVSTTVAVTGDVGRSGQIPLNPGGERILDLISSAGGPRSPDYETFVRVIRGGNSATLSLTRLLEDPSENIFLRPGDQVYVFADPLTFTVFGATSDNAVVPFRAPRLSLAEAVGRAGGLVDRQADPRGVFVFRYESPEVLAAVTSQYMSMVSGAQIQYVPSLPSAGVPVVYRLNLKDPQGYFASQRFAMKDGDVIFVSNAPAVEIFKFFDLIQTGLGTAQGGTNIAQDVQTLGAN